MARSKFLRPSIACFVLLAMLLLPIVHLDSVFGLGSISIEDMKEKYAAGDTVIFIVSGLVINDEYVVNVSRKIEDGVGLSSVEKLTFTFLDENMKVEWQIPYDAVNGTYVAEVFAVVGEVGVLTRTVDFKIESGVGERLSALTDDLKGLEESVSAESLLASLSNAIKKVESAIALYEEDSSSKTAANQLRAARNMLTAFVHKVLAQTGKGIEDEVLAADLITKANEYIQYIDSLIGVTLEPLGKKLALNVEKTLAKQEEHMVMFMVRKGLDEATTDEELLSLLNSMEEELTGALDRAKGQMKILEDLLASGAITDYEGLLMELEKDGDSVNLVKAMAKLLSEQIDGLEQDKPGLGAHLGQLKQAAKELEEESEAAGKSHGELTSEAHGKKEGKGHDKDGGGDGSEDHGGSGEDHGGSGEDHGGSGEDHGGSGEDHGGSEDHGKGNGGGGGDGEDNGKGGGKKK